MDGFHKAFEVQGGPDHIPLEFSSLSQAIKTNGLADGALDLGPGLHCFAELGGLLFLTTLSYEGIILVNVQPSVARLVLAHALLIKGAWAAG